MNISHWHKPQRLSATSIVAIRSTVTGHWGYCPEAALSFFLLNMEYAEDKTGHLTADQALDAARADKTIPRGATFKALEPKPIQQQKGGGCMK